MLTSIGTDQAQTEITALITFQQKNQWISEKKQEKMIQYIFRSNQIKLNLYSTFQHKCCTKCFSTYRVHISLFKTAYPTQPP